MRPHLLRCAVLLLAAPLCAQPVALPRAEAPLTLCDLATDEAVARWTGLPVSRVDADGRSALCFTLPQWQEGQNEWPAVYLAYDDGRGFAATDWSHYAALAVDVQIDGDQVGDVAVELRDTVAGNSYVAHHDVRPGRPQRIIVSLADVATQIALERVQQIVLYATRPKHTYTVTVSGLTLLPGDKPPLATFTLTYPNYRGMILPRLNRVQVSALLQPAEHAVRPRDLRFELACSAGGRRTAQVKRFPGTTATLSVPTGDLPAGPVSLTARVHGPPGDALAERTWSLRKLTPDEVRALPVYIDEYNNAVVEGKPFFPLGWYGSGSAEHAREIADSPFNCLLDYGTNAKPKAEMLAYLDLLQEHGLKLIYCLNDVYPSATYRAGKGWEGVRGNRAIAQAVVEAYRDHPALLAWYLNDELPRTMGPAMRGYYERVRAADPNHPCYIVLCNMAELRYFVDTTDVMGVDPYPIPQSPVTKVSDWMEWSNQATGDLMPTWLVPQAFAWYQHRPKGSNRARIPSEEDLRIGRAPTREEARCMTYLALAHGAKGLIYWCYYNMRMLPQYEEMWGWMKEIGAEVQALSPVLLAPADLGPVPAEPESIALHTKLKRHGGRLYLIAVNGGNDPLEATFTLGRKLPAQATVLFENRTVPTAGQSLTDRFEPLAVHVYELAGTG